MDSLFRRYMRVVVILVIMSLLTLTIPALAKPSELTISHAPNATITVTNSNDGGPGSLRQAIASAANGDTINFSLTYPAIITLTSSEISIGPNKDITIVGPGADQLTIRGNGSSRVFNIYSSAVTLAGLTVAWGNSGPFGYGGGIYYGYDNGMLTLTNVMVLSNTALYGGGVYLSSGKVTVNNGEIGGNNAPSGGGGVYVNAGSMTVNGGSIHDNTASVGGGAFIQSGSVTLGGGQITHNAASSGGGGVYINQTNAGFTETDVSTITLNTAFNGGAIYINSGSMTLNGGQIISNAASSNGWGGGVFISSGGNLMLSAGQVVSNTAGRGGGVTMDSGSVELSGGQIISNTAIYYGGGIYIRGGWPGGSATLAGGQIAGNTASEGGGVYVESSTAAFTQTGISTITHNIASSQGGGVYILNGRTTLSGGQIIYNNASQGGGVYMGMVGSNAVLTQTGVHAIAQNTAQYGGGLYIGQGRATLESGQVVSNTTTTDGGGMWVGSADVALAGAQVISNTAAGSGGGVYVDAGRVTLSSGEIRGNQASLDGGGAYVYGNGAVLTQTGASAVARNIAGIDGGGVYVNYGSAMLNGGQISNNTADNGGGVRVEYGNTTLNGGQILTNTAHNNGGGMYVFVGTMTLGSGQIVGNSATTGGGGLFISSSLFTGQGTATLNGGEIAGNTAPSGSALYNNGSISPRVALTIKGDVHQIGGNFYGGSAPLQIEGSLTLQGGVFDAPAGGFTITGSFTHTGGTYRQTQDVNGNVAVGFPRAGGIIINANGQGLGSTQVTIRAGVECTNPGGQAVLHCYNITPTNSSNVSSTITFYFNSYEVPSGNTCGTLNVYHWNGSSWGSALTLDEPGSRNCSSAPYSVRVKDVSAFSPFVLRSDNAPTAITLRDFQAYPTTVMTVTVSPMILWLMVVSVVMLILVRKQKRR